MLKNKIITVLGGAGLIGKSIVEEVLKNAGRCIIADYNAENGEKFNTELIRQYGAEKVTFCQTNITDKESIKSLINKVVEKYGSIDALINCAYPRNKNFGRHFFDVEYEDFCENVNLHLGGYFLTSQLFASFFVQQGYGNIINLSSVYGVIPPRFDIYEGTKMGNSVEYAVIKSGLIHLTKYMVKYLKGKNIRINSISPGGILDNQPEVFINNYQKYCSSKGMLDKSDICGTIIFLLSDSSRYINGQNIIVDDGFSL